MTDTQPAEAWRTDPRERLLAAIDRTWAYSELGASPEQLVDAFAHQLTGQQRDQLAALAREILYTSHNISSQDWARWREQLDTITDQEQP